MLRGARRLLTRSELCSTLVCCYVYLIWECPLILCRFNMFERIVRAIPVFTAFPSVVQYTFIPYNLLTLRGKYWPYHSVLTLIPDAVLALAPLTQSLNNIHNVRISYSTSTNIAAIDNETQLTRKHILDARFYKNNAKKASAGSHVSLFRHIFESDMPESELSVSRLINEAHVLLGAGTTTVSRTLDVISFYILANKNVRSSLQIELEDVMKTYPENIPSWAELEKLPYLQALIKEGLR